LFREETGRLRCQAPLRGSFVRCSNFAAGLPIETWPSRTGKTCLPARSFWKICSRHHEERRSGAVRNCTPHLAMAQSLSPRSFPMSWVRLSNFSRPRKTRSTISPRSRPPRATGLSPIPVPRSSPIPGFISARNRRPGLAVVTGQSGGNWIVVQFATSGGIFLVLVNGVDPMLIYDGTNWYPITDENLNSLHMMVERVRLPLARL
jgi:hypothetical protein